MVPGAWRFLRHKYNPLPSSPFEMRLLHVGDEEIAAALTVRTASANASTEVVAKGPLELSPRAWAAFGVYAATRVGLLSARQLRRYW